MTVATAFRPSTQWRDQITQTTEMFSDEEDNQLKNKVSKVAGCPATLPPFGFFSRPKILGKLSLVSILWTRFYSVTEVQ